MDKKTGILILIGVALAFAFPLVRLLTPGDRGPDTLGDALVTGALVAVFLPVTIIVRRKARAKAIDAGQQQREARSRD